jgi:hypothetical protein
MHARLPWAERRSYTAEMLRRSAVTLVIAAAVVLAGAAMAGCKSSSSGKKTPASPAVTRTAQARPTTSPAASPSVGIRSLQLASVPDVQALIAATGGQYVQAQVIYADVTEDGIDDAVVPLSSGGTMGDVAFIVLAPSGTGTKTLLKEYPQDEPGLHVDVKDGKLVMTQPVPGPDDPNCCPSFLRRTTYAWNGAALAIESVKTEANPEGGAKGTPSATTPPVAPNQ